MEELKVNIDGKEHIVKIEEADDHLTVHMDGKSYEVQTSLKKEQKDYDLNGNSGQGSDSNTIKANLPGVIFSVDVKKGDKIKKGKKVISLVAMKMENQILAPKDGKVKEVSVKKGDKVNKGDVLLVIE